MGPYNVYIVDSIASESLDSKSAGCQAVTIGEIESFKDR